MEAIVALRDYDNAIGNEGGLIFKSKEDMKLFREVTMGKTVICGRKTFMSLPKNLLSGRDIIVLTRDCNKLDDYASRKFGNDYYYRNDDSVYLEDDIKMIVYSNYYTTLNKKGLVVIGGAEIYKLFEEHISKWHISVFHNEEKADTFLDIDYVLANKMPVKCEQKEGFVYQVWQDTKLENN